MHRRKLLAALVASGLVPLGACAPGTVRPEGGGLDPASRGGTLYVPGYNPRDAVPVAEPADSRRRRPGLGAQQTLVSRLSADGALRQAVLPLVGHDIAIAPNRRLGFMGRMGNSGNPAEAHHVLFDPDTLELRASGHPPGPGWRGGGHGVWLPDGSALLTAERAPGGPYSGRPEAHYGRIAIRDPRTLRLLDWIPCHGIDPHEIRLSSDGRHVLAANYGSVANEGSARLGAPRRVVEACVTITDLASGALVEKVVADAPDMELRHLAQAASGQIFGIRCRLGAPGADAGLQRALGEPGGDITAGSRGVYLPAAPVLVAEGQADALARGTPQEWLRQGLSVEYEPAHDEFLATFPSSHRLLVFNAQSGRLRRSIDTRAFGLRYPSGLALLSEDTYAVAGYREGIAVLDRGTHRINRRLGGSVALHGHSHMTAV